MEVVLVICGCIALALICNSFYKKKVNSAGDRGMTIQRDRDFFRQAHVFTTSVASVDSIFQKMDKSALTEYKINYSLVPGTRIEFSRTVPMIGTTYFRLSYNGMVGEKHRYTFMVTRYVTRNGAELGVLEANIALTGIEKAILSLDPKTTVERVRANYK